MVQILPSPTQGKGDDSSSSKSDVHSQKRDSSATKVPQKLKIKSTPVGSIPQHASLSSGASSIDTLSQDSSRLHQNAEDIQAASTNLQKDDDALDGAQDLIRHDEEDLSQKSSQELSAKKDSSADSAAVRTDTQAVADSRASLDIGRAALEAAKQKAAEQRTAVSDLQNKVTASAKALSEDRSSLLSTQNQIKTLSAQIALLTQEKTDTQTLIAAKERLASLQKSLGSIQAKIATDQTAAQSLSSSLNAAKVAESTAQKVALQLQSTLVSNTAALQVAQKLLAGTNASLSVVKNLALTLAYEAFTTQNAITAEQSTLATTQQSISSINTTLVQNENTISINSSFAQNEPLIKEDSAKAASFSSLNATFQETETELQENTFKESYYARLSAAITKLLAPIQSSFLQASNVISSLPTGVAPSQDRNAFNLVSSVVTLGSGLLQKVQTLSQTLAAKALASLQSLQSAKSTALTSSIAKDNEEIQGYTFDLAFFPKEERSNPYWWQHNWVTGEDQSIAHSTEASLAAYNSAYTFNQDTMNSLPVSAQQDTAFLNPFLTRASSPLGIFSLLQQSQSKTVGETLAALSFAKTEESQDSDASQALQNQQMIAGLNQLIQQIQGANFWGGDPNLPTVQEVEPTISYHTWLEYNEEEPIQGLLTHMTLAQLSAALPGAQTAVQQDTTLLSTQQNALNETNSLYQTNQDNQTELQTFSTLAAQTEASQDQVSAAQSQLTEDEKNVTTLTSTLASTQSALSALQDSSHQDQDAISSLTSTISGTLSDLQRAELSRTASAISNTQQDQMVSSQALQNVIPQLQGVAQDVASTKEGLSDLQSTVQKQNEETLQRLDALALAKENSDQAQSDTIKGLTNQLQNLTENLNTAQSKLTDLQALVSSIQGRQDQQTSLQQQFSTATDLLKRLTDVEVQKAAVVQNLQKALNAQEENLAQANAVASSQSASLGGITSQVTDLQNRLLSAETSLNTLQQNAQNTQTTLSSLNTQHAQLEETFEATLKNQVSLYDATRKKAVSLHQEWVETGSSAKRQEYDDMVEDLSRISSQIEDASGVRLPVLPSIPSSEDDSQDDASAGSEISNDGGSEGKDLDQDILENTRTTRNQDTISGTPTPGTAGFIGAEAVK